MKTHPALFEVEGGGGGAKKLRNTFQRLRPEEFSSWRFWPEEFSLAGDFGLKSFCKLAILTWPVKAHPALFEGEGRGKKIEEHLIIPVYS